MLRNFSYLKRAMWALVLFASFYAEARKTDAQRAEQDALYPVRKGVVSATAPLKTWRWGKFFIRPEQVERIQKVIQPGDIILSRKEWYVANLGVPGFWTHVALYVGTLEERQKTFPDSSWEKDSQADQFQVVEATSEENVWGNSLLKTLEADYIAILRPNVSRVDRLLAVKRAIGMIGYHYDYYFDYESESWIYCSELVYQAYLPGKGMSKGLQFKIQEISGVGLGLLPNHIAEQYASEKGSVSPQMEWIAFIDSHERLGRAYFSSESAFVESHQRGRAEVLIPMQLNRRAGPPSDAFTQENIIDFYGDHDVWSDRDVVPTLIEFARMRRVRLPRNEKTIIPARHFRQWISNRHADKEMGLQILIAIAERDGPYLQEIVLTPQIPMGYRYGAASGLRHVDKATLDLERLEKMFESPFHTDLQWVLRDSLNAQPDHF